MPPIISGDNILAVVDDYCAHEAIRNAYHGSPHLHGILRAETTYWRLGDKVYPDSDGPVVCADESQLIPTFMASAPRGFGSFGYEDDDSGNTILYMQEAAKPIFEKAIGYVAVSDFNLFERVKLDPPKEWPYPVVRRPELRSASDVVPDYLIRVTYNDFSRLLRETSNAFIEYRS